jgi:hypothetical protein
MSGVVPQLLSSHRRARSLSRATRLFWRQMGCEAAHPRIGPLSGRSARALIDAWRRSPADRIAAVLYCSVKAFFAIFSLARCSFTASFSAFSTARRALVACASACFLCLCTSAASLASAFSQRRLT